MGQRSRARQIIHVLESGGFYAECPCCEEPVRLSDCGLFYLDEFTPDATEVHETATSELDLRAEDLRKRRKSISLRSEVGAKAVNIGFILERLAPSMKTFRFSRNDCRSLFDPIDYVIFEGLSAKGAVSRIIFADIKTGGAPLSLVQKEIRSAVEHKKVEIETYQSENTNEE
jgi:predicted Holliday junction resolvase-like endonuclease